jgi:N-acetylneuraminic acid mutarotase
MRTRKFCLLPGPLCGFVFGLATVLPSARAQTTALDEWTWMGGSNSASNSAGQFGVDGTLGTPAAGNIPGSTFWASSWTDRNGNFWLFGGDGNTVGNGVSNGLWELSPSTDEWTWMGGTVNASQPGVYGTLGTPAAANFPGARASAETWTGKSGNLWLFSGTGADASGNNGFLNDLWQFNPSTNEWTWMGGSNIATYCDDTPGGTGSCFNVRGGIYGTLGTPAPGNLPGARTGAVTWTDAGGNLWLFGGGGYDANGNQNPLNDLWEFSPATNEWTWMGGSSAPPGNSPAAPGVYGTLGSPAAANIPGARSYAAGWTDASGNLWLFGGEGYPPAGVTTGPFNDLWKFNPSSNEWTWMGGGSAIDQPGVYGALETPAAGVIPGGRLGASSWTDRQGNFWLFAGEGIDAQRMSGFLNDLWEFSPSTGFWAWMGGSSTVGSCFTGDGGCVYGQPGVYGTLGTPGAGNNPGGRAGAVSWADNSGDLWLFGGEGFDGKGDYGILNDLWEYQPGSAVAQPAPDFSIAATPASSTVTAGQYGSTSISVTPANGFNSTVSFSCSGLPSGATCVFSPQTVTPSAGVASTALDVTTSVSMAVVRRPASPLFPITALAALVCCIGWKRRRLFQILPLIAVGAIGLSLLNGCSGETSGGVSSTPQSATYTITVNAISGSLQHSTSFSLTVN